MEKTLKTIARDLTWFKDSHTAKDGWGRRKTEQDNCEKSRVMLHIKEPCLRGRASSQVIRIGPACADARTLVRAKGVTSVEYCAQLNLLKSAGRFWWSQDEEQGWIISSKIAANEMRSSLWPRLPTPCFAWFAPMPWLVVTCSWWPVSFPGFEKMAVRPIALARCHWRKCAVWKCQSQQAHVHCMPSISKSLWTPNEPATSSNSK